MFRRRRLIGSGVLGGGGLSLPVDLDLTALSDGELPLPLSGSTWAISSGHAINTPTTEGSELVTDGNMEAVGVTAWVSAGTPTTKEKSTTQKHGGSQSLHVIGDAAAEGVRTGGITTTTGKWYRVIGWSYAVAGSSAYVGHSIGANIFRKNDTAAWVENRLTVWELGGTTRYGRLVIDVGEGYWDDVSLMALSLPTLIAGLPASRSDVIVKSTWTIPFCVQAGHVINLDSLTIPLNGVFVYINRLENTGVATLYVMQLLAGVPTQLAATVVTYSAGGVIETRKSGTTLQVYYEGAQVGTDITLSEAAIISNRIHAALGTDQGAQLDRFFVGTA